MEGLGKAGSDADIILQGWDETNFGTPIIYEKSEPNKVELVLPVVARANGGSNGGSSKGKDSLKKTPYTLLGKKIVAYCNSWRSNQEIAETSGYDVKYLGSSVIPRMVAEGLLEKKDKESNRSPTQKYRAVKRTVAVRNLIRNEWKKFRV